MSVPHISVSQEEGLSCASVSFTATLVYGDYKTLSYLFAYLCDDRALIFINVLIPFAFSRNVFV